MGDDGLATMDGARAYPAPQPTLQLARRRGGRGARDGASRQAQRHRRWTSIGSSSEAWKGWETATKEVVESKGVVGEAIKFVVPPRAEGHDQTYVLFALDGPFRLTSFSQAGRRFAIFERMPSDHMIEGDGAPRGYEPDAQKAAAQDLADAARDLVKIQNEIAMGLRDKDGRVLPTSAPPAEDAPDDQATAGALPGAQHQHASQAQGSSSHGDDASEVAGSHCTIVGAGGGLLLAANMTLLLTERPGASLVVGPCYANVQEGSRAMQNGSYAIGLSEIYAIDFEAGRRLEAQKAEAAAIEAAFLRELEREEGKKSSRKSKSKKKKKKPAAGLPVDEVGEEEEPIPEDLEEVPLPEPATARADKSDSDREDGTQPAVTTPASPGVAGRSSPASPGGWSVVGEKKKSGQSAKGAGPGSPVEPLDLMQEPATPQESSPTQQHTPSSATSEPGSAGKKSRGRRGGRRRKRGGKGATPDAAPKEQHPQSSAVHVENSGRAQPQQTAGWDQNSNSSAAAWSVPGAGRCFTKSGSIQAHSVTTGSRYCEPGATTPQVNAALSGSIPPDPWCGRGVGQSQQPQQQRNSSVAPNWGSMKLGNGLFDPSAGFLGPAESAPAHEPALMQSIVGALGLDDF